MNKQETSALMMLCYAGHKLEGQDVELMVNQWHLLLNDLPFEACQAAAVYYMRTVDHWAPKPFDIRKALVDHLVAPDLDPKAAFAEVLREVKRVGLRPVPVWAGGREWPAPTPAYSSPFIAEAVESIGWDRLCTFNTEKESGVIYAQFTKALEETIGRARARAAAGTIPQLGVSLPGTTLQAITGGHTHESDD